MVEQTAAGEFAFAVPIQRSVEDPITSAVADFDGDGDLDVLGAAARSRHVFWTENLRGGLSGVPGFGRLQTIVAPVFSTAPGNSDAVCDRSRGQ